MAIALFLATVIAFFSFISIQGSENKLTEDADILVHRIRESELIKDGEFSEAEESRLVEMNCTQIKELFESRLELCIYLRDSERNVVPLTNGSVVKYGVGCPGVLLNGEKCGSIVP